MGGVMACSSTPRLSEFERKPEAKAKKDDKKKPPPLKRKLKTLPDLDLWEKVKAGLQVMMIGVNIWAGVLLFLVLMVFLGILNGPEYAEVVEASMTVKTATPEGEIVSPDMPTMMFGIVTGVGFQGIGKIFYILATVLSLFQIIVLMAGYGICLKIPDRFGTRGQAILLLCLGGANFFLILIFRLLPALGVMNYIMVPFALPEVSMVDASIDRDLPIWVAWSATPFWEMVLSILFICSYYAEPVFIGVFIWSIGMTLREEPIVEKGQGVVSLAFGICFALVSFQLLSMAGTSSVAVNLLRVVYAGWIGFTIILLVRLPMALQATRAILQKYLDGAELKDEEPEDEEEEEKKPKRKRKAKRARDEDDD